MKIVAKPIKTMAVFEYEGKAPVPFKFKYVTDDGSEKLIYIDMIISSEKQRRAGIETIIYECQSVVDGIQTRYRLKYIPASCRWQLYAI